MFRRPRAEAADGAGPTRAAGADGRADGSEQLLSGADIRSLERMSMVALNAVISGFRGQRAGARGGVGLEFADYRPYRPGDDLRRIDWNAYERVHELLIKVAPEEGHIELDLLVDLSASMDHGSPDKLLHARRLAAALATVSLLRSDTVRAWGLADGDAVPTARMDAPRLLWPLADQLAALAPGRRTDLRASVSAYRAAARDADLAILISDGLTAPAELRGALAELSSSARSCGFVHVLDRSEADPPQRGAVELRDSETGRRVQVDLSPAGLADYRRRFTRFREQVAESCAAVRAGYVLAWTDIEPVELLASAARSAELVALSA